VRHLFAENWQPKACAPSSIDANGNETGCFLWEDADNPPSREQCEKVFAAGGCFFIEHFCKSCEKWSKGCAPAGKPKKTVRTRFLINQHHLMGLTHMPFDSNMGTRTLPVWVAGGLALVDSLFNQEKEKRHKRLMKGLNHE